MLGSVAGGILEIIWAEHGVVVGEGRREDSFVCFSWSILPPSSDFKLAIIFPLLRGLGGAWVRVSRWSRASHGARLWIWRTGMELRDDR